MFQNKKTIGDYKNFEETGIRRSDNINESIRFRIYERKNYNN